jgi:hypothetical protein
MPDREQHLTAAEMNSQLGHEIGQSSEAAWQVWSPTITFYTGVQLVEAALALLGVSIPSSVRWTGWPRQSIVIGG